MKTTLTAIVLTFVVITGSAMAQSDQMLSQPPMQRWKHVEGANALKLTDQQKKDIQKIKLNLMQKQIDIRAKIAHARLDYEQLTSADSPDEDAIAAKIDETANLQTQLKKNMLDGWFAVNKILAPDQQKMWKKVLEHPGIARQGMMMRFHTNGRNGGNGMMMRRRPEVGSGPMMDNGQTFGESLGNDLDETELNFLGPMADSDMFDNDLPTEDSEMFDMPMMDNMDMMDHFNMIGTDETMRHRIEMMQKTMEHMPDLSVPDSSK